MSTQRVVFLPGDGIGPEVAAAARRVVDATDLSVEWVGATMGLCAFEAHGDALPPDTVETILDARVALKGPTTTPVGGGHVSANVRLRKELDLYANVRPVKTVPGLETPYGPVDLVIVRENTESLYAGIENEVAPGVITSIKVITDSASRRIARFAFFGIFFVEVPYLKPRSRNGTRASRSGTRRPGAAVASRRCTRPTS